MNFTTGVFDYFGTFMDSLAELTQVLTMSFREIISQDDGFVSALIDFFNINIDSIPTGILDIKLAVFIFGTTLVGVMMFNIIKWIAPII